MKTICEKCIFADYANTEEPCKMHIPELIADYHDTSVSDNNFYIIPDYYCRYGFNIDTYDKNKEEIGTIGDLKKWLEEKRNIRYYLVIDITDINNLEEICDRILKLKIKPKFISFVLHQENKTEHIIALLTSKLDKIVQWKIHNFLEEISLNNALSTIFDINAKKNDTIYFWLQSDTNTSQWHEEEDRINELVYLYQPKCHCFFRSDKKDGLFLSFDSYKEFQTHLNSDIFTAIDLLNSPKFIYYA